MHTTKFTRGGVANMLRHYDRTARNIGNENIAHDRTRENYNLAPTHSEGARQFVMSRCETATNWEYCKARQKTNVLCDTVVTLPKDYKGNEKAFFKACYDFLANRYGKENVVSAFVHTDETTPHLHFAFVPICADGRLSAKDKVNRKDLQTLHKDCEKYLADRGIQAHLLNEATSKANRSIVQLQVETLVTQKTALEGQIAPLQRVQEVKSFGLGKKAVVNKADLEMLQQTAGKAEGLQEERKKALSVLQNAKEIESRAEQKAEQIIDEARKKSKTFDFYKKTATLQAEVNKSNKAFSRLLKAVEDCGTDIYNKVADRYNQALELENEQSHNHDMDLER